MAACVKRTSRTHLAHLSIENLCFITSGKVTGVVQPIGYKPRHVSYAFMPKHPAHPLSSLSRVLLLIICPTTTGLFKISNGPLVIILALTVNINDID